MYMHIICICICVCIYIQEKLKIVFKNPKVRYVLFVLGPLQKVGEVYMEGRRVLRQWTHRIYRNFFPETSILCVQT